MSRSVLLVGWGLRGSSSPRPSPPDIGNVSDDDTVITYAEGMIQAQVECRADPTDAAYFVADKRDLVIAEPGAGIIIPMRWWR